MRLNSKCVITPRSSADCDPINIPIYASTVSRFVDSGIQYYPRYFNTVNQEALAAKIAALESADDAVIFSSGMAAISTTLLALLRPGDHLILPSEMYGGTISFIEEQVQRFAIDVSFVDTSISSISSAVNNRTKVIMIESPTNPFLSIVDLRALADIARPKRIITVIDNTFASPVNQRPIELGIDISIHSGTKFLSGHSDLCCGAVAGSSGHIQLIRRHAHHLGGCLNALDCYLLDRSLKTLFIRVKQQNANALKLAEALDDHKLVSRVYFPGLESHPGYEAAKGQMDAPGSMLSVEFAGVSIAEFLRHLRLVTPGISLGGVETTICAPYLTSHHKLTEKQRQDLGIRKELLRFSVGIEAWEDLVDDVQNAINAARV